MNFAQSAKYLRVHVSTINRLVREGKLRKLADGGINSEDLELVRLEWEDRKKIPNAKWLHHGKTI